MQQQSSPLGPEVGWGVGLVGFATTAVLGWLMDAGVGFMLVLLVFWGGIGGLFAFLVDRSTTEEHDRVEELQNTRLATLGVAPRSTASDRAAVPEVAAEPRSSQATTPQRAPAPQPAPSTRVAPSPRAYRERRAEDEDEVTGEHRRPAGSVRDRDAERAERDRAAAAALAAAPPGVGVRQRRSPTGGREATGHGPATAGGRPGPPRRPAAASPGAERSRPRSPREYREAKLDEAARRDQAAA